MLLHARCVVQIAELQGAVGRAGRLISALGEREGVGSEKKAEQGGGLQLLPLRTEQLGLWVKPAVPVPWS